MTLENRGNLKVFFFLMSCGKIFNAIFLGGEISRENSFLQGKNLKKNQKIVESSFIRSCGKNTGADSFLNCNG